MYHFMRQIIYWWRRDSGLPIPKEHIEFLEEAAERRIHELRKQGYTSGELIHDRYTGWWSITNDEGE